MAISFWRNKNLIFAFCKPEKSILNMSLKPKPRGIMMLSVKKLSMSKGFKNHRFIL